METLKIARVKAGLSQQELAVKMNLSQPQISNYERGFKEPSDELKKKFEKVLGVKIKWEKEK